MIKMNRIVDSDSLLGVSKVFSLLSTQKSLRHEQRLQFKHQVDLVPRLLLNIGLLSLCMIHFRGYVAMQRRILITVGHAWLWVIFRTIFGIFKKDSFILFGIFKKDSFILL